MTFYEFGKPVNLKTFYKVKCAVILKGHIYALLAYCCW